MHILMKIILLTVSFNQLRAAPLDDGILTKIVADDFLASCSSVNSFLNLKNNYLMSCNISASKVSQYNSFTFPQLLCLSFYDVNLRMCEMKIKYPQLDLPTNISQVVEILNGFDQNPSIVKEFCLKSPERVSYGNSLKLLNYSAEFQESFNDSVSCNLMCIEQIMPKQFHVNPFCKIFLWGNLQLKAANTYFDNLAKTAPQSKMQGNVSSERLEPQAANVSNENIVRTGERPQVLGNKDDLTQVITVANVTNVPSTTIEIVSNNSVKPAEPERVIPAPMAVDNPPMVPQQPASAEAKSVNTNVVDSNAVNANVVNSKAVNPNVANSNAVNSNVDNPNVVNSNAVNSNVVNPNVVNSNAVNSIVNPNVVNSNAVNSNVVNPNVVNPKAVNSNDQLDDLIDPEKDEYDSEPENEIGNSELDDPLPQNVNEGIVNVPIQLEPIHKSSQSSEKADKGIVFAKDSDANPKMVITEGQFIEAENGHFFPFFLSAVALSVLAYVLLHNKKKVMALLIEGRQGNGGSRRRNSRGHAYRRLDTLEQAISSKSQTAPPANIIY